MKQKEKAKHAIMALPELDAKMEVTYSHPEFPGIRFTRLPLIKSGKASTTSRFRFRDVGSNNEDAVENRYLTRVRLK